VTLAVSDTGTGMTADMQRHIFEPFFTTKERGKGTGLGLATVYGIVQQSDGLVQVSSEVGRGTTVTVSLPEVAGVPEPLASVQAAPPSRRGTETILLVEDDSALRALARSILKSKGYRVLSARSRDAALVISQAHSGPIQLMLTDVVMPGMTEPALASQLAASRPAMKTVYMSGYPDETITRRGVLVDGVAFLQKPFTAEALLRKVGEALARTE
jgi:two-component system cell cycle sensor histidine kinase/response regulator CckA